jgi:hypothetical protein
VSSSLGALDERFAPFAQWFVETARSDGYEIVVTSTRRSVQQQEVLWEEFQAGGRDLPALPPNRSLHVRGLAFDCVVAGNYRGPLQAELGQLWQLVGGTWGGQSDPVHFQPPAWWLRSLT